MIEIFAYGFLAGCTFTALAVATHHAWVYRGIEWHTYTSTLDDTEASDD